MDPQIYGEIRALEGARMLSLLSLSVATGRQREEIEEELVELNQLLFQLKTLAAEFELRG